MGLRDRVRALKIVDEAGRARGLEVLRATYREEKRWVDDEATQLPADDLERDDVSWFLVEVDERPVGILRVLYDPPLELYRHYEMKLTVAGIDVEEFLSQHRIAEIGRFAVLPEFRKYVVVVATLMRAASSETVSRGFTHYITDVFEDDPHSPYRFHTRIMGFQPVATHEVGELNSSSRRITLLLDLKAAYQRLRAGGGLIYRVLTEGWDEKLHERMGSKV
ncbi:MAG: GNAT family N-acetyltransferase [Acidobacteriota bacterium]|nr:MAG: GNAT family N-acetyltransferase [Acidobacteriota bacterium]